MKRWRWWAERGVFAASVCALVATSPAKWSVKGTITGTTVPSSPSKALSLTIEATHPPTIHSKSMPSTYGREKQGPCLVPFVARTPMTCLLPPGATLDGLEMSALCKGGCDPCTVPPGAYAKADVKEVDVSIDGDTKTISPRLPSHNKDFIATRFDVTTSGAAFIKARMVIKPRGGGAPVSDEEQACELDHARATIGAICTFTVFDSALAGGHDFDVTVDATGYDECAKAPCTPPKTFHIDAVTVVP